MKTDHLYLIALGSNQRHSFLGGPAQILEHAIAALEMTDISVFRQSHIIGSRPIGPSRRVYANSAAIIVSALSPRQLIIQFQHLERHFCRRRLGQKWGARTLDIDIILWSGGIWTSNTPILSIPHIHWKDRAFVLGPAAEIAGDWRDPLSGLTIKQLFHRFMHPKPLDHKAKRH
jgi:2-amino-4-hydroxy-6-hydroxymethyldihydropteridine diphosphokinase